MTASHPSHARHVWGEVWRVLAAAVAGLLMWFIIIAEIENGERIAPSQPWLDGVDLGLGLLSLVLLLLRRRWRFGIALVLALFSVVSISAVGALGIATISLATTRRWAHLAIVAVPWIGGGLVYESLRPSRSGTNLLSNLILTVVVLGLCIAIGFYISVRRDLITTLRDRAETAEREQAMRVAQARANERARIAREMHDVLAHRISLVAMHSGALAYRTDLPPDQLAEAAAVVRDNAHLALGELRDVLGVLREVPDGSGAASGEGAAEETTAGGRMPASPQPTLRDLGGLLEESRAAGAEVRLSAVAENLAEVPETVSRNAFRIIQETLTNARKHAPGVPVDLTVGGAQGEGVSITVRNGMPAGGHSTPLPPSGMGLTGLAERAHLSGGTLTYGADRAGAFVVRAWLPWAP
jgi:signal transduction histidine kinase